jgi:hypothetical protein
MSYGWYDAIDGIEILLFFKKSKIKNLNKKKNLLHYWKSKPRRVTKTRKPNTSPGASKAISKPVGETTMPEGESSG